MSAEVPGFDQESQNVQPQGVEKRPQAPGELLAYIDNDIAQLRARIDRLKKGNIFDIGYEEQLTLFERLRQEAENGQFNGITALLESRRAEAEQAFTASRQKLHGRGEMPGDDEYFALKDEILTGEKLSEKVSGIVDDAERAWLRHSIALREQKQ